MLEWLAPGLNVAGGLLNNWFAGERQKDAQNFNAAQQAQAQAFAMTMRNTAYQATMKDMRKAGLNPILAYQRGPTSSPTGAMASTTPAQVMDSGLGAAASSALAATRLKQELDNMRATEKQTVQLTEQSKQEQRTREADEQLTRQRGLTEAAETAIRIQGIQKALAEASKHTHDTEFYKSDAGRIFRMIGLGRAETGFSGDALLNSATSVINRRWPGPQRPINKQYNTHHHWYEP